MTAIRILILALLTIAGALALAPAALAQTAPAGNAHPEHQSPADAGLPNPFGQPAVPSPFATPRAKHEFAQQVDLSPLRDLAIYHNGRVKILGTAARESVEEIAGRRNYFDVEVPDGEAHPVKLSYDPVFTYLDLLIDPAYYLDKPIIHVEYLPLRRAFVDRAFADEAERERWMRLTRLSIETLLPHRQAIMEQLGTAPEIARGVARIESVLGFLRIGHGQLQMAAPHSEDEAWLHISALPAGDPAREAFKKLGAAWRAGDAPAVNAAAAEIASILPSINPTHYPTTQRTLESMYNSSRPFEYGYWAYFLSLLSLLLAFGTGRRWLVGVGVAMLAVAIVLHTFGFGARWIIAERIPIQNQFESMTGLSLGGVLVGAVIMLIKRQWLFGAAAAGVGFLVLLTATTTAIPGYSIGREAAILNTSVLLKYHVTTVLVSYGLITLAFFISLLYLWTHYAAKVRGREAAALAAQGLNLSDNAAAGPQRVLADLDRAQMTVLQLAFWSLGVGVLLGAWWADHSWGRWWAFDPKETWALITWIVYLIVIHVRLVTSRNRALVTAWLSIVGFFVMLWTYFGVNLILPGLHAYA